MTACSSAKPYHRYYNRLENQNWVSFNNLGFHDIDRDLTSRHYRLLVIGDSFVEGVQVPIDSLFTRQLELRLAQHGLSQMDILNCGLSGTQTAYQYKLWQEYIEGTLTLHYDHVLLVMFLGNDLTDNCALTNAPNASWFVNADGTVFTNKRKDGWLKGLFKAARNYSALVNTLYDSLYRLRRMRPDGRQNRDAGETSRAAMARREAELKELAMSGQGTSRLIAGWATELHDAGKAFDVALIPGQDEGRRNPVYETFIEGLRQVGGERGFGVLYLEVDENPVAYHFASGSRGGLGHLNVRGHEFVAGALYDWLMARYGQRWSKHSEIR